MQPIKETPLREPRGLGIKLATFMEVNKKRETEARRVAPHSELTGAARQGAPVLASTRLNLK